MAEGVRKINEWVVSAGRTLIITDPAVAAGSVPEGTLLIDATDGTFKIRPSGSSTWVNLTPQNLLMQKSITAAYLADRSITDVKIALDTIATENLKDLSITAVKLADISVTTAKLADGAVSGPKLAPLSIDATKLVDNSVSTAKIQDLALTNDKLANGAVTSLKIADLSVTTIKIVDLAVAETKIANLAISTGKIADLAVTTAKLAALAVDNNKLADNAVTANKIGDGQVTANKLVAGAVTTIKLADLSVTDVKIADQSVLTRTIKDAAVTNAKIATGAVSLDRLDVSTQGLINNSIRVVTGTATVGGNLQVNGAITATGNITGAKVFNAVYNDLAEAFEPAEDGLEEGDIVEVDELGRVFKARSHVRSVVGVVSERFAMLFGGTEAEIDSGEKVAVGLIGRVPVKVIGSVNLGDYIVSAGNGVGVADNSAPRHLVIGKAIESKFEQEQGKVMCLIFPA